MAHTRAGMDRALIDKGAGVGGRHQVPSYLRHLLQSTAATRAEHIDAAFAPLAAPAPAAFGWLFAATGWKRVRLSTSPLPPLQLLLLLCNPPAAAIDKVAKVLHAFTYFMFEA
ncbi:Hypothetical predicted protein [Cloeon dipterum]|uniref:Uncharacterized protein n=1 Tax=Cloeon dipterum TaxID=197152 RepID=A0A8S1CPS6_9INSE|nr:Hypothetical predicted protein [Cloeon dipterum]